MLIVKKSRDKREGVARDEIISSCTFENMIDRRVLGDGGEEHVNTGIDLDFLKPVTIN